MSPSGQADGRDNRSDERVIEGCGCISNITTAIKETLCRTHQAIADDDDD